MELSIKKAQCEIRNVNLRTENNGDERVLAVDLKVKANVSAKEIAPLLSDTPELMATLFDKSGNVLNPVVQLQYRVQIENVEIKIDKIKAFKGARIKKNFPMIPRNGKRFEIMFTVQLHDVPDIRMLADLLHEECSITVIERQAGLDFEGTGSTAAANAKSIAVSKTGTSKKNGAKKTAKKKAAKKTAKKKSKGKSAADKLAAKPADKDGASETVVHH